MWNTGCYIRCTGISEEREKLIMTMREKVDPEWQSMEDDERVAAVLSNPGNNLYIRDQRRGGGTGTVKLGPKKCFCHIFSTPLPTPSSLHLSVIIYNKLCLSPCSLSWLIKVLQWAWPYCPYIAVIIRPKR